MAWIEDDAADEEAEEVGRVSGHAGSAARYSGLEAARRGRQTLVWMGLGRKRERTESIVSASACDASRVVLSPRSALGKRVSRRVVVLSRSSAAGHGSGGGRGGGGSRESKESSPGT